jgi:FkbM family methyltransferase
MLNGSFRKLASILPRGFQDDCRRFRFSMRARNDNFSPNEPEAEILDLVVTSGDWVLDIGANVGQYTLLLSKLIGPAGRVLAFEPVPTTAATLALVCAKYAKFQNISLLNLAASEESKVQSFEIPTDSVGLPSYARAHATDNGTIRVFGIAVDSLGLQHRVSLAKIDAEGGESAILRGMLKTIEKDHPVLIIEDNCDTIPEILKPFGYTAFKVRDRSRNTVYLASDAASADIRSRLIERKNGKLPLN